MIEAEGLTTRYGDKPAVDDLSFTVRPRVVTEFLAPTGPGNLPRCGSSWAWMPPAAGASS